MYRGLIAASLAVAILASTPSPTSLLVPRSLAFAASPAHVYALPARVASPQIDEELEVAVLNLINHQRAAAGVMPLMPHATIRSAARAHGRELFAWGYLTHLSRDGKTPRERVLQLGVRARLVGENLAYAADARAAHDALMASEAHRRNILLPQFQLVGVAVIDGGPEGVILVEDFSDEGVSYHLPRWWEHPVARATLPSGHGY